MTGETDRISRVNASFFFLRGTAVLDIPSGRCHDGVLRNVRTRGVRGVRTEN